MIHHLRGRMIEKSPTQVVLECHGVGYQLEVSLFTFSNLSDEEEQFLYTYLLVKEDSHTLYGFQTPFERTVFKLMLSVSGVGASTARTMLSSLSPTEIIQAIQNEEVAVIQSVKGIGMKTAQRVILDLKDKVLGLSDQETEGLPKRVQTHSRVDEAISALEVLGFSRRMVQKVVEKCAAEDPERTVEDLIRFALNAL